VKKIYLSIVLFIVTDNIRHADIPPSPQVGETPGVEGQYYDAEDSLDRSQKEVLRRRKSSLYAKCMSFIVYWRSRGHHIRWIVLTSTPEMTKAGIPRFSHDRDVLFKAIRLKFGRFEYIDSFEQHTDDGMLHLNILCAGSYIPQDWLSKKWEEVHGGSFRTWITLVNERYTKRMAGYLSKYLVKCLNWRYSRSRGAVPKDSRKKWNRLKVLYGTPSGWCWDTHVYKYNEAVIAAWHHFLAHADGHDFRSFEYWLKGYLVLVPPGQTLLGGGQSVG
jgi:hypothetical protein